MRPLDSDQTAKMVRAAAASTDVRKGRILGHVRKPEFFFRPVHLRIVFILHT